jgi:hypothetical protein
MTRTGSATDAGVVVRGCAWFGGGQHPRVPAVGHRPARSTAPRNRPSSVSTSCSTDEHDAHPRNQHRGTTDVRMRLISRPSTIGRPADDPARRGPREPPPFAAPGPRSAPRPRAERSAADVSHRRFRGIDDSAESGVDGRHTHTRGIGPARQRVCTSGRLSHTDSGRATVQRHRAGAAARGPEGSEGRQPPGSADAVGLRGGPRVFARTAASAGADG